MTQYLLLIHANTRTATTELEWGRFFSAAKASGLFAGGSELANRLVLGGAEKAGSSSTVDGFMRFDADDKAKLLELLASHPVVLHGGTVELFEMPKSP